MLKFARVNDHPLDQKMQTLMEPLDSPNMQACFKHQCGLLPKHEYSDLIICNYSYVPTKHACCDFNL